jgi:signal transduction histidine kinase
MPLSEKGLEALQGLSSWTETARLAGERVLIVSVPVIVEGQLVEIVQLGSSLAVRDQSVAALGIRLLAGGLVATLVAFAVGWWLAGLALRPIQRMTQTAQAIGAERDLSQRVEHDGPDDEVGELAKTLNGMLDELQGASRQIERSLKMQQQFVADVSHELRTPLTTLNGNIALLRREPPIGDEDRVEILADMAGESERLIRLVRDLLALARADAHSAPRPEPVAIGPLVDEVCRQARVLDPARDMACEAGAELVALAEPDAVRQVLLILLDNAIRHAAGPIHVSAAHEGRRVVLSVRDSGPGIPPAELSQIFERFHRGSGSDQGSGSGLGLAIARALVEAQGGRIRVESEVGVGSAFTVSLPAA